MIADDVRELIRLFESSDLSELEIEQGGRKLLLRKGELALAQGAPAEPEPSEPLEALVKAHMVGIFYWTRDKTAKPAISLHQHVEKGQVVGFVEAMGIMNEVEAEHAGAVIEIAVASGQPVEYGQTLMVLRPD